MCVCVELVLGQLAAVALLIRLQGLLIPQMDGPVKGPFMSFSNDLENELRKKVLA